MNKNIEIKKIYSVSKAFIFHDNNNRIYLQRSINDNDSIISLEHADYLATKGNCIALLNDIERLLRGTIRLEILCDIICFSENGKYLFGISKKESFLFMYQVDNGKCLEKLFIENISLLIQATTNRLILNCNNQLVFIHKETTRPFKRDADTQLKKCLLFENAEWISCYEDIS